MSACLDHGRSRSLSPDGYALVGWPGRRSRCVGLHRLVYVQHNNCTLEDIVGSVVRHTCDNTRCILPEHLVLGTSADNNRDRAERGRSARRYAVDQSYIHRIMAGEERACVSGC